MRLKSIKMLPTIFLCLFSSLYSENIYQFEKGVPKNFILDEKGTLEISKEKFKDGNQSLKWNFNPNSTLSIFGDVGYKKFEKKGKEQARLSYVMWVYNEKPVDDVLKIDFLKSGERKTGFEVKMNFTGWRTMWVQYDRDMNGVPEEEMNEIRFIAPKEKGTILLDQIMPAVLIDPRHNARDEQVDFVNLDADISANAHWMALYKFFNQIEYEDLDKNITESELKDLNKIEESYEKNILKKVEVSSEKIKEKREQLIEYKKVNLEFVQRLVIYKGLTQEEKDRIKYVELREFGTFIRELGYMYHSTENKKEKDEIISIYREALEYMYEQGWDKGSAQGTIHHLGYQMRELYAGIYLLRDGLTYEELEKVRDMVVWYASMGIIYGDLDKERGVNLDVLNTMLPGIFTSILINPNEVARTEELNRLKKFLDKTIVYSPGLSGGFKDDGSVFHHMQSYPAYAKGAFMGLTPIMYYLSQTSFQLSEEAYGKVKNSLLMTRVFSNKYNTVLSMSGRHPNDEFGLDIESYRYVALAKNGEIDKELIEAYLRLVKDEKKKKEFEKLGFQEEKAPNGSWTVNMSSAQFHRQGEWLVGAKGFSRYLVGNETYIKNNIYGRYMSYGTVQFLQNSLEESGYVQEGWDWAHYPGATAIALPIEKMKSDIAQVDIYSGVEEMLFSDETFSGGNNLNGAGMSAMKLHEHPKYNETHRARKSVFFFGNRVVLLGSDIENNDKQYETHTTLFQNFIPEKEIDEKVEKFNGEIVLEDNLKNLYKVKNREVVYSKRLQISGDQKTGEKTENNYELAYINHGENPKNSEYEYSILIQGTDKEKEEFRKNDNYKVINKDFNSHIVEDLESSIRAYVLFEAGEIEDELIVKVDTPSMIMAQKKDDESIEMSFVDPDLRLYEGIDESQYDKNGKRKEVSIYSRSWKKNDGIEHTTTLILKGKYTIISDGKVEGEIVDNNTVLKITSQYATPIKFILKSN